MTQCPECGSIRVVIVLGQTSRGFCGRCGTRWMQDGSAQRAVRRPPKHPRPSAPGAPA